jgi:hypothetical protein
MKDGYMTLEPLAMMLSYENLVSSEGAWGSLFLYKLKTCM